MILVYIADSSMVCPTTLQQPQLNKATASDLITGGAVVLIPHASKRDVCFDVTSSLLALRIMLYII